MSILYRTHCTVIDPELDSAPLVVVYPGTAFATSTWMVNQALAPLKMDLIFVVPSNYDVDCKTCLDEAEKAIGGKGRKISSYSLCGFSRGGICVPEFKDVKDWEILGLIDPSTPAMGGYSDTILDNAKSRIRCVYRMANWAKSEHFQMIKSFHQHLVDLKVKMVDDQEVGHPGMPALFFRTYGSDF